MAQQQQSSTPLPAPLRTAAAPLLTAASLLRKVPGAGTVGRAAEGMIYKVGAMSPRGRRIAVYTGAGVLGVAGAVEWPVAVTGAAVAWLTQPWRGKSDEAGGAAGTQTAGGGTSVADDRKAMPSSGAGGAGAVRGAMSSGGTGSPVGSEASGAAGTPPSPSSPRPGTEASTSRSSTAATASGGKVPSAPEASASTGRGRAAGDASESRTSGSPTMKSATSGTTARRGRTTRTTGG